MGYWILESKESQEPKHRFLQALSSFAVKQETSYIAFHSNFAGYFVKWINGGCETPSWVNVWPGCPRAGPSCGTVDYVYKWWLQIVAFRPIILSLQHFNYKSVATWSFLWRWLQWNINSCPNTRVVLVYPRQTLTCGPQWVRTFYRGARVRSR